MREKDDLVPVMSGSSVGTEASLTSKVLLEEDPEFLGEKALAMGLFFE